MSDPVWLPAVMTWAPMAHAFANIYDLDAATVLAVIAQESRGRPGAWNPEPRYRWLWNIHTRAPFRALTDDEIASEKPPADFPCPPGVDRDAEWWGQTASWGLMQVMGAVARERGFDRTDLPDLCTPRWGIEYGCQQLAYLQAKFGSGDDLLATYNGGPGAAGGNRDYVTEVRSKIPPIAGGIV